MLAIVLVVHQVESHLLQPVLMGHAVALHPLAVIVVVASGTYLFGVVGALFAVPVTAMVNTVVRYLAGGTDGDVDREPGEAPGLVPDRAVVSGPDDDERSGPDDDEPASPGGDPATR